MRLAHHLRRFAGVTLLLGTITLGTATPTPVTAAPVVSMGAGGEYHPLAPARIFDSRPATAVNDSAPGPKAATPSQPTFDIQLRGRGGVPEAASDVLAVVVNITVTEPTAGGWLNAFGSGEPAGTASIVNFAAGQTVPNLAIVRPGANGNLTLRLFTPNASATAHVVVDVFGWFSTSTAADRGARLIPVSPGRILDTRDPGKSSLGEGKSLDLQIRGATMSTGETIPNDPNIVGAVLNVTGINTLATSMPTFVSVVPDAVAAGTRPSTSNVNLSRGQIKPNMVIVPIGADGAVHVYNNTGTIDLAVDVAGYLVNGKPVDTREGRVVPLATPYRVFDTREAQWGAVALGPGQAEDWSFADFVGSVNIGGVAVGEQSAVIGNLTSASLTRQYPSQPVSSFLTAYPSDAAARPNVSNLNIVEGPPVPNLAILKYSATHTVRVYNLAGYNHYLYDASAVVLADPATS